MLNKSEIEKIQSKWGDVIIKVGKQNSIENKLNFLKPKLKQLYDFDYGIQFKPTKASNNQFRNNFDGALSYFLGYKYLEYDYILRNGKELNDSIVKSENINFSYPKLLDKYSEDKGFALSGWDKVIFENDSLKVMNNIAVAMGNYFFEIIHSSTPLKVKAEYTFIYRISDDGIIKIILQHSSFPFNSN